MNQHQFLKFITCSLACITSPAFAENVTNAKGDKGTDAKLVCDTNEITTDTDHLTFCPSSLQEATEAILWMPDMGHGSSPTKLAAAANNCTRINETDFFMKGKWEVKVTTKTQEKYVFTVDVK